MKRTIQNLVLVLMLGVASNSIAQGCPYDNSYVKTITLKKVGETVKTSCLFAGEYIIVPVKDGNTYDISTCSSNLDLEISVYDATGANVLAYNDDGCGTGAGPSYFSGTVNFDGELHVLVDEFPCSHGTTCIDLEVTLSAGVGCEDVHGTDVQIACNDFVWIDGLTYTEDNNTATHTLDGAAVNGCDSIVTLDLTIKDINIEVLNLDPNLVAINQNATFFQWLDCINDYEIIPNENSQDFLAKRIGSYAVIIIENGCVDTSDCYSIFTADITETVLLNQVQIFPNPTNGQINITTNGLINPTLTIYNISGQLIYNEVNISKSIHQIEFNQSPGIYFVEIESSGIKKRFKLIKE